jgi:small subunit ribosomal protein S6
LALYETVLIARQDVSAAQVDAIAESLTSLLKDNGGTVKKTENWGLRSLAYRIKKNRKGHYVMLCIDGSAQAIAEMERSLRYNEDVLRYMTVRVDAIDDEPSAVLQQRDRGDRPERGERGERGGRFDRGDRGDRGGDRGGPRRGGRFASDRADSEAETSDAGE